MIRVLRVNERSTEIHVECNYYADTENCPIDWLMNIGRQ